MENFLKYVVLMNINNKNHWRLYLKIKDSAVVLVSERNNAGLKKL
jgi:hypothetical protein